MSSEIRKMTQDNRSKQNMAAAATQTIPQRCLDLIKSAELKHPHGSLSTAQQQEMMASGNEQKKIEALAYQYQELGYEILDILAPYIKQTMLLMEHLRRMKKYTEIMKEEAQMIRECESFGFERLAKGLEQRAASFEQCRSTALMGMEILLQKMGPWATVDKNIYDETVMKCKITTLQLPVIQTNLKHGEMLEVAVVQLDEMLLLMLPFTDTVKAAAGQCNKLDREFALRPWN